MERAVVISASWVMVLTLLALVLLWVPVGTNLLVATTVHLSAVVIPGLVLAMRIIPSTMPEPWFEARTPTGRWLRTGVGVVALVTGQAALVTLASSAALRLQPSLQFLQLLSAMDIAWVTTGTMVGLWWYWGRRASMAGGVLMAMVCVWSSWRYLAVVGFADDGGWLVDGAAMLRMVIPIDAMAAGLAIGALAIGVRKRAAGDVGAPSAGRARPSVDRRGAGDDGAT